MARTLLENAILLDPEASEPAPGSLLLESGRIEARLRPEEAGGVDAARVDLAGARIAPGFLDLHFHGELIFVAREALDDALRREAARMLRHGTTAFLPTTVAWSEARLSGFLEQLVPALASLEGEDGAAPLGLHLEGPWINPGAAGAQPVSGIRNCVLREAERLIELAQGLLRMVTLAPEAPGATRLIEMLRGEGVVASLGHSLADDAEIDAAVDAGLTHVTHLFNAMGHMRHREPGVPGRVLADDRLSCDLICDGAHVHPHMVRIAARAKGERLILITDRVTLPAEGTPREEADVVGPRASFGSGQVRDDGVALRLPDGRLAGSSLTLDRAARNARSLASLSMLEAVAACTLRPARVLGREAERGTLRPGARADLAVLDAEGRVAETWLAGRRVYRAAPG